MKTAARSLAALALGTAAIVLVLGGSASAAPSADDPVFVGAGDIAGTWSEDEATELLLDGIPGTVFTIGDNVYPDGTPSEFSTYYAPTWGRHKARTRPTPGNHDYHTANATGTTATSTTATRRDGRRQRQGVLQLRHRGGRVQLARHCAELGVPTRSDRLVAGERVHRGLGSGRLARERPGDVADEQHRRHIPQTPVQL